jgi:Uma2 family endonuclease
MMTLNMRITVEEFEAWTLLPENRERNFEFIGGEIVEVVSDNFASILASYISGKMIAYLEVNPIGLVTGSDGGYIVGEEHYIPDVAFFYNHKLIRAAYNPNPPDLAVEVLSPTDSLHDLMVKVYHYTQAGRVVWVVYPDARKIEVYAPGQSLKVLGLEDTLDGGLVLPGFSLAVKAIFAQIGKK